MLIKFDAQEALLAGPEYPKCLLPWGTPRGMNARGGQMPPKKTKENFSPMDRFMERFKGGQGGRGPQQTDPSQKKVHFSLWYFIAVGIMLMLFQSYLAEPQRDTIPYSEFKQLVK
jgi:hypothetical protein